MVHNEMESRRLKRRLVGVLLVATVTLLVATVAARWIGQWPARVVMVAGGLAILTAWFWVQVGGA